MSTRVENAWVPMKVVYRLAEELKNDPGQVALAQALTQDKSRPSMGLKGTFGLFASPQWWDSIDQGRMPLLKLSGVIGRTYVAGQDESESVNSMELILADGSVRLEGIYANNEDDKKLFRVGCKVEVIYARDELKQQPGADGGINYSEIPLEMAVSLKPARQR
jgi:hypothetical protein